MKCPKCHYISFDEVARCRNCGYDFTLSDAPDPPRAELPLQAPLEGPSDDFPLRRPEAEPASGERPRVSGSRAAAAPPLAASDLPLFDAPVPGIDDTPLLTAPSPPRAPLAVRRSTADGPRAAASPESLRPSAPSIIRPNPPPIAPPPSGRIARPSHAEASQPARAGATSGPIARAAAAIIDGIILGAIDAGVIYFTLALTAVSPARLLAGPAVPLAAFLLLLNGGYLVGFTTASGQTIGKMITGVRVVGDTSSRVPLGHAIVRAAATLVTILSLGLGYLPVFFGRDRRALHDRLAGTRVVGR
jgi:uncharacterized RDD family membrane protein YckC